MATDVVSGVTEKVLTHEVGAGAPCLKCGSKCPGLDLHFWRKICRNCKCKQEDHDVQAEVTTRGIENIGKLLMHDQAQNETTSSIPQKSSPKKYSPEKKAASPEKTHFPDNTKPHIPVNGHNDTSEKYISTNTVSLPPPDVSSHHDPLQVTIDIGGKQHQLDFGAHNQEMPPPPPSGAYPGSTNANADVLPPPPPDLVSPDLPPPPLEISLEQETQTTAPPPVPPLPQEFEDKASLETKPQTTYTSTVTTTQPESSSVPPPVPPTGRRGSTSSSSSSSSSDTEKTAEVSYDWTPPVRDPKLASDFIASLPEEKQPISGTVGGKYRRKQLMRQLPAHDQEPSACHDLTPQEKQEMEVFVTQYREKALGVGNVDGAGKIKTCHDCNEILKVGDVMVVAERAGPEKFWHPQCFVCTECKELLVDLIYFYNEEKIYCGRHYCELHKPRCAACDELIFAPEYTQAEDCYWHLKHFCCWQCDQPLGGKNYVPHDNQPVCIPCYEKSFAHKCATCKNVIAPNIEWVTFQEYHWHALPECFKCANCSQSLVGKPCIPKGDMVFCSSKCKREKLPPQ